MGRLTAENLFFCMFYLYFCIGGYIKHRFAL